MELNGGDINGVFLHDLRGNTFGVKPNKLVMDINGGDKKGVFLHDRLKITEGQKGQFSCISNLLNKI